MTWNTVVDLHRTWGWVTMFSNGFVGLWCTAAHQWAVFRRTTLWWAIGAAQVAVFIQVILGVMLVSNGYHEPAPMHMFYGFVAIISIAILFGYRHSVRAYLYLLYGLGSLFIMGLGIRALFLT